MEMIAGVLRKTRVMGELVMFSHTLFSLPFALIALVWAADGVPSLRVCVWALVALIAARNGANAFNRLVDARFDEENPRTRHRHLPQKLVKPREVAVFICVNYAVLVFASYMLNPLCFLMSPVAIVLVSSYSYTKRFTWLSHLYLGFTIASAPIGASLAVTGEWAFIPFVIGTVVMLWIAGFDILYATQDIDFDRKRGLYSIPSFFGLKRALLIAKGLHLIMIVLLFALYWLQALSWLYLIGLLLTMALLGIEHKLVKPSNRRIMKLASYKLNQVISMVILAFTMLDFFLL